MKRPAFTPRDRRAIAWGAAVLVPAFAWTLVVSPYLGALGEAKAALERDRALLRREMELLSETADYRRAFDDGAEKLLAAAPRLMGGDDDGAASAAVAGYLRRLARSGGAHVTRVEPGPSRDAGGGVTALPVGVSGESDLEGLLTFLQMLEAGPKLVDVAELRIEASGSGAAAAAPEAAYGGQPFYTPAATPAAQPEVITFRFTATGFTLAQPANRADAKAAAGSAADADAEPDADVELDAGRETEPDAGAEEATAAGETNG
ncbi:type II secretion system protein GspM [Longimicrobium sp.]|uniref:type II secretion system protein GspM n=1 Tax=Longimicrobium sp. TaxID=2029185 RepID=UPI003B3B1742